MKRKIMAQEQKTTNDFAAGCTDRYLVLLLTLSLVVLAGCAAKKRLAAVPDALETLTRLSSRYALGMLTNGAPDLQREKIAASGLESLFQAVVISGLFGIGKPRREIFLHLTDRLGIVPDEAMMVGNSLERDIAGARNAGIKSIWFKVTGSEEPAVVEPDLTITGLAELPALLERFDVQRAVGA